MALRAPWSLLLAVVQAAAAAGGTTGDGAQAIERERAAEHQRHAAEQTACRDRFDATRCLEQARDRHRQALAALQMRQQQLDQARREQRARGALERVEARQRQQAGRHAPVMPAPADEAASAVGVAEPVARTAKAEFAAAAASTAAARHAAAQARAAQRAQAAQRLQQEIHEDQARVASRVARRAAAGKVSQPLPAPASAP